MNKGCYFYRWLPDLVWFNGKLSSRVGWVASDTLIKKAYFMRKPIPSLDLVAVALIMVYCTSMDGSRSRIYNGVTASFISRMTCRETLPFPTLPLSVTGYLRHESSSSSSRLTAPLQQGRFQTSVPYCSSHVLHLNETTPQLNDGSKRNFPFNIRATHQDGEGIVLPTIVRLRPRFDSILVRLMRMHFPIIY